MAGLLKPTVFAIGLAVLPIKKSICNPEGRCEMSAQNTYSDCMDQLEGKVGIAQFICEERRDAIKKACLEGKNS